MICDLDRSKSHHSINHSELVKEKDLERMIAWWREISPDSCSIMFSAPRTHLIENNYILPQGLLMLSAYKNSNNFNSTLLVNKPKNKEGNTPGRTSTHPDMKISLDWYLKNITFFNEVIRKKIYIQK